ncbi:hypothetical protein FGG08_004639 [Glutinoglossum americanum]|uniref:Adenylyl cyclase-associated protein n=1 Tax=Glutinoglossum americanum TaxID=1670608 RepID=A0A9P8I4Q2_9PEZI|nr:hypothetical protein FGG08_004639 [Glutinoglossum americanum]
MSESTVLIGLMCRLEAATSRLEDMAQATIDPTAGVSGGLVAPAPGAALVRQGAQSAPIPPAQAPPPPEPLPRAIEDFGGLINGDVQKYVSLSEGLGGLVAEQAQAVSRAFSAQRKFLVITTKAKKPDIASPTYMEILTDLQKQMGTVNDIREANRGSPLFNHLSTVSEGITALAWVTYEPKPANYLIEILESAQFYGNRVLKEYKEKDQKHVDWVQSFYQIFRSLTDYVKHHYNNGVTWNNKDGVDAKEALKQVESSRSSVVTPAPASGGAPPPPPPPPPLPNFQETPPATAKSSEGAMDAVFEQLSKGEAVTAGLKKVDKSQMTHKNPSLRATAPVPSRSESTGSVSSSRAKSPAPPGKKPKPESMRTKKPSKKELSGNKWFIENHENASEPISIDVDMSHSILISKCSNTTLRINGKATAISIDNSPRLSLIIDSLISVVDIVKSPNFAIQVLGTLPTILLDQVDGATIYLSKESLTTEVFTSKCTSVNINVPPEDDSGDYRECPVPEQFKSTIKNGQLITEIVEHSG